MKSCESRERCNEISRAVSEEINRHNTVVLALENFREQVQLECTHDETLEIDVDNWYAVTPGVNTKVQTCVGCGKRWAI